MLKLEKTNLLIFIYKKVSHLLKIDKKNIYNIINMTAKKSFKYLKNTYELI